MPNLYAVTLDPAAIATDRTELSLNSGSIRIGGDAGTGVDWGNAEITAFEAEMQQYGNAVSDYRFPNRTITIPLMVSATDDTDFETAFAQLRQKVALFQREGGWLLRQRADGDPLYAEVVNATLTVPDAWGEAGELEPGISLVLEALPDFFGEEITLDEVSCTGHCAAVLQLDGEQAVIEGDHPGRVRIVVTDTSGNIQNGLLWGVRSRHYDSDSTAALVYEAEDLEVVVPATVESLAGASGGQVVTKTMDGAGFGNMLNLDAFTHVGCYGVFARVYATATDISVRLGWALGSAPTITNNQVTIPAAGEFFIVGLGVIMVGSLPLAPNSWQGYLEASGDSGDLSIDQIFLKPLDESAGTLAGSDLTSVIEADSAVEIRWDGMYQYIVPSWAPISMVTGDLARLPPSGMEGRACEVFVKPSQGRIGVDADSGIDAFTVQVIYRPTYLFRP